MNRCHSLKMYLKFHIKLFLAGWGCLLLCSGCSTRLNTKGSRAYHEFTTRYNVYHNAKKAYCEILDEQLDNFQDDYSRLLPLYPYSSGTPKNVKEGSLDTRASLNGGGAFDVVIHKNKKAIQEHSITAKPRRDPSTPLSSEYRRWLQQNEFNPFIHNAWLLMGKAYVQDGHQNDALAIFDEVVNIFGQDSDATQEAQIWMARAYTELGRLQEAEQAIYALKLRTLPSRLEKLLTEVQTQYLLEKGEHAKAIPYLIQAIEKEKRAKQKKRWQFLLGQLYTLSGDIEQAQQAFKRLKRLNTPKDMLQQVIAYQSALVANSDSLSNTLNISLAETSMKIPTDQLTTEIVSASYSPQSYSTRFQAVASTEGYYSDNHWDFFRNRWERGTINLNRCNTDNKFIDYCPTLMDTLLISPGKETTSEEKAVPLTAEMNVGAGVTTHDNEPEPVEQTDSAIKEMKLAIELKAVEEVASGAVERAIPDKINTRYDPILPEELKQQLKRKEAEALSQPISSSTQKSRKQQLKERDQERKKLIKQRQKELKKRKKEREKQLKQREKERVQKFQPHNETAL